MIARLNWAAKAVIAFGVPAVAVLVDLSSQWLGFSEDGVIDASEWQLLLLAVIAGVGVFFKKNGPEPA